MSVNTLTHKVEFRFTPGSGSWEDMSGYIDKESGLSFGRGIGTDRKMRASGLTFSMDNSSEDLTFGNASSTYFNKIRAGIELRYSWTYSATTKYEFRGYVGTIRPKFVGGARAKNRVEFQCEGQTSFFRRFKNYGMTLQTAVDVDDALAAIMTAVGQDPALYSFDDSALLIPYVFPRSDPLTDLVAAAQSDPGMLLFEDGQGRMRLKSMVGGNHASPTHTWGGTIYPENDVSPDYQNESQVARASVALTSHRPQSVERVLYRHPINSESGFAEPLAGYTQRVIAGEFEVFPDSVVTAFTQTIIPFQDTLDSLYAAMSNTDTTLYTSSSFIAPTTFVVGDEVRVDQEVMTVTGVSQTAYYQQKLTVTRAQRGTLAVAHTPAPPTGTRLYKRAAVEVLSQVSAPLNCTLNTGINFANNSVNLVNAGTTLAINDYIKVDAEIMKITSIVGTPIYGVQRAQFSTTATSHASGAVVQRRTIKPVEGSVGTSYIRGSEFASGLPAESPDLVGNPWYTGAAAVKVTGNKFIASVYNNSSQVRYLAELVIGGKALNANSQTANIAYEKAIPYVLGVPEASAAPIPFGVTNVNHAKAQALTLLRAGRVPTPWLTLTFTANAPDNTVDMQTAEIGDLVRYTGTGSYRERVDEWYRIVGVKGDLLSNQMLQLTFTLAPSHLWRNPSKSFFTDFSWGYQAGQTGNLGEFIVGPADSTTWSNQTNWLRGGPIGGDPAVYVTGMMRSAATMTPTPAVVDVGADVTIGTQVYLANATATFPANTGGLGVAFRANSATPSSYWECRFNKSTNKIILWNTNDGVVAEAAWTSFVAPEMEVRCQGNRIRVFVDCNAEPIIDTETYSPAISSTIKARYQTQTFAGLAAEVSTLAEPGRFRDFVVQGL